MSPPPHRGRRRSSHLARLPTPEGTHNARTDGQTDKTDRMSNIGRQKCKYFGATFFFSFEAQEHLNYFFFFFSSSIPLVSDIYSSEPPGLVSAPGAFSPHTSRPTANTSRPERENGQVKKNDQLTCCQSISRKTGALYLHAVLGVTAQCNLRLNTSLEQHNCLIFVVFCLSPC